MEVPDTFAEYLINKINTVPYSDKFMKEYTPEQRLKFMDEYAALHEKNKRKD